MPSRSRSSRSRRRSVSPALLVIVAVVAVAGAYFAYNQSSQSPVAPNTPNSASGMQPATELPASAEAASALLETIVVKGKSPKTGYDREGKFGSAWFDVDENGCDTRNDILARDLTSTVLSGDCRVMSGLLDEPYTGTTISFVRGVSTSALVQIDHVVALSNAWQTGAQKLSQAQRVALANDPLNLFAVDGATNSSKGDGDAATWLPPAKAFRCEYVTHQIQVKAKYSLWVTKAEKSAMVRVLATCS